jgi:hypothetical protein
VGVRRLIVKGREWLAQIPGSLARPKRLALLSKKIVIVRSYAASTSKLFISLLEILGDKVKLGLS